jgi:anti-sigma factor RsiW
MTPVQVEELSAFIDGELDAQRSAEVEAQIASDRELRAAFEALRDLDRRWRASARKAAFVPEIRLPPPVGRNGWVRQLAAATALVGVRLAVRLTDTTTLAFVFQLVVLVVVLVRIVWLERRNA